MAKTTAALRRLVDMPPRTLGFILVGVFFVVLFAVIRRLTRGPDRNSHPTGETSDALSYEWRHSDGSGAGPMDR